MKKFKIPQIPQTTSKSIRFPNDVIDEVESVLVGTDCTFSAFFPYSFAVVGNFFKTVCLQNVYSSVV